MNEMHLRSCPYCGTKIKDGYPDVLKLSDGVWSVDHYCDRVDGELSVCIHVYGKTKKEAVDRWNHRAGEVADG